MGDKYLPASVMARQHNSALITGMALKSGTYVIVNKAENSYIGRTSVEDRTLYPKRIGILPQGVEAPKVRCVVVSSITHY